MLTPGHAWSTQALKRLTRGVTGNNKAKVAKKSLIVSSPAVRAKKRTSGRNGLEHRPAKTGTSQPRMSTRARASKDPKKMGGRPAAVAKKRSRQKNNAPGAPCGQPPPKKAKKHKWCQKCMKGSKKLVGHLGRHATKKKKKKKR